MRGVMKVRRPYIFSVVCVKHYYNILSALTQPMREAKFPPKSRQKWPVSEFETSLSFSCFYPFHMARAEPGAT